MCEWGFFILAISVWLFWSNNCFFVFVGLFWCFSVSFLLGRAVSACFWHCIWHLPTPDIYLTHSDTILTLPDTLRHHPDTPQASPFLVCMRPLGEREISEYYDIYLTVFNLSDICQTQTSARLADYPALSAIVELGNQLLPDMLTHLPDTASSLSNTLFWGEGDPRSIL